MSMIVNKMRKHLNMSEKELGNLEGEQKLQALFMEILVLLFFTFAGIGFGLIVKNLFF